MNRDELAHELWAAAHLAPGEGISDAVARMVSLLAAQPAEAEGDRPVAYLSGSYRDVIEGRTECVPLGAEVSFVDMGWMGQIELFVKPCAALSAVTAERDAARNDLVIVTSQRDCYANQVLRLETTVAAEITPVRKCRCTMRQQMVGDGCYVCNPEYAADHETDPALAAVSDSSDTFYAGLYKKSAPMWHRLHELAVSKGYDHVRFAIECAPVYKCDCMGARKVAIDMAGNTIPCECVAAANETEPAQAQGERYVKGDTDPVGDCDKFEAGIHVDEWLQRIVVYGDSPEDAERLRDKALMALTRPAQTEQQPPYPHEAMDVIATSRYQVVASGSGPLSRYYVRAGDGKCELYRGGKSDCEHVARKLEGAFLDGGLTAFGLYAASIAQTASQQVALCEDEGCPHHGTEHVCRSVPPLKPRRALLELAQQRGAILTGKPDGSEPISLVFSIEAWRAFDAALQEQEKAV